MSGLKYFQVTYRKGIRGQNLFIVVSGIIAIYRIPQISAGLYLFKVLFLWVFGKKLMIGGNFIGLFICVVSPPPPFFFCSFLFFIGQVGSAL